MKYLWLYVTVAVIAIVSQYVRSEDNEDNKLPRDDMKKKFVESNELVIPYEGYDFFKRKYQSYSYVIDNKFFVGDLRSRCLPDFFPTNPSDYEPSLVVVGPKGETTISATASKEAILAAGLDPKKETIIVVHGYTQSYPLSLYLHRMRNLFQENGLVNEQNLIFMDYSKASKGSYAQIAAASELVSVYLASFIMKLIEQLAVDRKAIHLIGNSLGAQIASLAAKRIRPSIGRITALDPAGPCFGRFGIGQSDSHHRLSSSDADEVVVQHYDKFIGTPYPMGHVDIYVNGGSNQPGCSMSSKKMISGIKSMISGRDRVVEISHTRGQDLITSPLPDWCQQVAYMCASYRSFMKGECGYCNDHNDECYLMSMYFQYKNPNRRDPNRHVVGGKYYISTRAESPWCSTHYQILINLDNTPGLEKLKELNLELLGDDGETIGAFVSNRKKPNQLSYLLLTNKPPTRFKSGLIVPQSSSFKNPTGDIAPKAITVEVNYMSNMDPEVRRSQSSFLCLGVDDELPQGPIKLIDCK